MILQQVLFALILVVLLDHLLGLHQIDTQKFSHYKLKNHVFCKKHCKRCTPEQKQVIDSKRSGASNVKLITTEFFV